ncbi:hypothetical protein TcYC6_0089600 [Trypanosoma cruzi]|nr:hypothetical protein TcYC6_0089600 [Trypanosoma cruzi]
MYGFILCLVVPLHFSSHLSTSFLLCERIAPDSFLFTYLLILFLLFSQSFWTMSLGRPDGLVSVSSCFGRWDAVFLRKCGDGALLVRDERRSIHVTLVSREIEEPRLLLAAWDPQDFAVRANHILYDTGPVEIRAGDKLQLTNLGAWSDEDGLYFSVENVEASEEALPLGAQDSAPKTLATEAPSETPHVCGDENAWRVFMRDRLERVGQVLSLCTNLKSPSSIPLSAFTAHAM